MFLLKDSKLTEIRIMNWPESPAIPNEIAPTVGKVGIGRNKNPYEKT